jgi:two-component system response regulator HydG
MSEESAVRRSAVATTVLVVEDEEPTRKLCSDVAESCGMKAISAATVDEALVTLESQAVDIVLTDLKLPQSSGLDLLKRVRDFYPQVAVLVLTQYGTIDSAVEATRMGAADYVTKPFHVEDLRRRLMRAARDVDLNRENQLLREQLRTRPGFGGLIGVSERMQRVYKMIEKVSQHEYPVLILGESGTGKEMVARSIHFLGERKNRPFAPVDCSALVPTLIESELFGYVKGAFTGAVQAKQGLLEAAQGGTLFLDEIGDLPVDLQAKLLRVLQEREVKPVGSTERRRIDVRIIAATNRDLEAAIRNGSFRQDLYFRLNVVQIKLPPLRERKSDIALLVTSFLDKFADPPGAPEKYLGRRYAPASGLRLAGKRPRTGERHRARRGAGLRPDRSRGRFAVEPALSEQRTRAGERGIVAARRAGKARDSAHLARNGRRQTCCRTHARDRQDDSLPQIEAIQYGACRAVKEEFKSFFSVGQGTVD